MAVKGHGWRKYIVIAGACIVLLMIVMMVLPSSKFSSDAVQRDAASFPNKPITLVVPYAAGGGTDITARALTEAAEKYLDQPIVVVNRTGGGGAIGLMEGANARPDGYTVTYLVAELTTLPHMGLLPITYEKFEPIAQTNFDPSAITVRADAPWTTAAAFLEYARTHPGEVKMGNAGTGSIWHLAAATLEKESGVTFTHIPYEGAGPAVSALASGFVDAVPVSPAEVKSLVEQGQLRTLAVNTAERSEALPKVPTLYEATGLRFEFIGTLRGLAVPKGTPQEITDRLEQAFMQATEDPIFRERMRQNGLGLMVRDSESFGSQLKEYHDLFSRLIPELGLSRK